MGRRRKITAEYIAGLIAGGWGSGHGERYQPFMKIEHGNASTVSNQKLGVLPDRRGHGHFFSRTEDRIAHLCSWIGARDVRTQFPMWPMEHLHPGVGLKDFDKLGDVQFDGLIRIANACGIEHGVYVGTRVPYVATMDLMVTVARDHLAELAAIAVKPRHSVEEAGSSDRILERLSLGKHYCASINVSHRIADIDVLSPTLNKNLNSYAPHYENVRELRSNSGFIERACELFHKDIDALSKRELEAKATRDLNVEKSLAQRAFSYLAWRSSLDVNLAREIFECDLVPRGARQVKRVLQENLFGRAVDE